MRIREKKKRNLEKRRKIKKEEIKILQKIDTLPIELVGEIHKFLPLKIQNIIHPLENCIRIQDLMLNNYWINFYLYFFEFFNHNDPVSLGKLKRYFNNIKNVQYVQCGKEFYHLQDKIVKEKLKELAEDEVQQFNYGKRQHNRNVEERVSLSKSINEIQRILEPF